MVKWWEEMGPPVYVAAAAYLGLIKTKKELSSPSQTQGSGKDPGNLEELAKLFGADGMLNG